MRLSPGPVVNESCCLTVLSLHCLSWKLLEPELFCSREEDSWPTAQLLGAAAEYADPPGSSTSRGSRLFSDTTAEGAATFCLKPWRHSSCHFPPNTVRCGSICSRRWRESRPLPLCSADVASSGSSSSLSFCSRSCSSPCCVWLSEQFTFSLRGGCEGSLLESVSWFVLMAYKMRDGESECFAFHC